MSDAISQTQEQHQEQTVTVNVASSGDPVLETRIFRQVHSVGRQLGRLAAVIEILLQERAQSRSGPESDPAKERVLQDFRDMQAAIDAEKRKRIDELAGNIVRELEDLKTRDPAAFDEVRRRLGEWLKAG